MMHKPDWTDADIHAYVDGALDAGAAARLRADCARDGALAARVAQQRQLLSLLRNQFDPVLDEAVPRRLLATLDAASIESTSRPLPLRHPAWWGALAASLLAGIAIGWWSPARQTLPLASGDSGPLATGALARALSEQLSSSGSADQGVRVVLSFRDGTTGRYCRAFTLSAGADGLACRSPQGWELELLVRVTHDTAPDRYRQASTSLSNSVLAQISERQAEDSLDPDQERTLRARQWLSADPAR